MREWLVAIVIVLSLFKLNSGQSTTTKLQIGAPWIVPFDSPMASCIRRPDEALLECAKKSDFPDRPMAVTLTEFPCRACLDLSVSIAAIGKPQSIVEQRRAEFDALTKLLKDTAGQRAN